jgi:hypothetical protein
MAKTSDDRRLDLLQGTLDMLKQDRWSRLVHAIGRIMNSAPADSGN